MSSGSCQVHCLREGIILLATEAANEFSFSYNEPPMRLRNKIRTLAYSAT